MIPAIGDHTAEELRNAVIVRLRGGWSQRRIRETLPVRIGMILRLAKETGASYLKPRGRGRRFTPEFRAAIRAAVASGKRSAEIQREFSIDYDTVAQFRRELGDLENRRHWMKLSAAQVAEATEALKHGDTWRTVATTFGVALATLQRAVSYRKRKGGRYEQNPR